MRTGASFLEPTHLIDAPEIALPSDAETTVPVIPGPSAKREGQQPEMGTTASKTIVARPITSGLTAEFRGRTAAVQHAGAHRAKVSTRLDRPRPCTLWITDPCNDLLGGTAVIAPAAEPL